METETAMGRLQPQAKRCQGRQGLPAAPGRETRGESPSEPLEESGGPGGASSLGGFSGWSETDSHIDTHTSGSPAHMSGSETKLRREIVGGGAEGRRGASGAGIRSQHDKKKQMFRNGKLALPCS